MGYLGKCWHCDGDMEINNERGGRLRLYCSDRCRKAANRDIRRARAERDAGKRDTGLSRNEEQIPVLRQHWQACGCPPGVERMLVDMYIQHGLEIAHRTGEIVLAAIREERSWTQVRISATGKTIVAGPYDAKLAQMLERKDERVKQFLEECGL